MNIKIRRCTECKQVFATPQSFFEHKKIGGNCRSVDTLMSAGFERTSQGWRRVTPKRLG